MKFYSGIGSRITPPAVLSFMTKLARFLSSKGYILRSGGAPGADSAFEAGVQDPAMKEIYLPWKGFNGNASLRYHVSDEALELAEQYHPAWNRLSHAARKLMARNCYQVLGSNLENPVEFVACWTKDGKETGGTAQAMRIARAMGIPVLNLFFETVVEKIESWITLDKVTLD